MLGNDQACRRRAGCQWVLWLGSNSDFLPGALECWTKHGLLSINLISLLLSYEFYALLDHLFFLHSKQILYGISSSSRGHQIRNLSIEKICQKVLCYHQGKWLLIYLQESFALALLAGVLSAFKLPAVFWYFHSKVIIIHLPLLHPQ